MSNDVSEGNVKLGRISVKRLRCYITRRTVCSAEPGCGARLAGKLPIYYGWVIFALANLPSFGARPVASVAVLSVFVIPMTEEFGWSRGLFSGAVSLGAVCGLVMSPFAGRLIDRYGSGLILAGLFGGRRRMRTGAWRLVTQAWSFYAIYVPGRAVFSSPLELGTTTAISNWFIRRRPMALAWFGAVQGVGLGLLPLAAAMLIDGFGWQSAWVALGVFTVTTGVLPPLLLMARRPEDMGITRLTSPASPGSLLTQATARTQWRQCTAFCLAGRGLHGAGGTADPGFLYPGLLFHGGIHGAGRGQPAPDGALR